MVRPSPSESATINSIGKVKIGNDGNKWVVFSTKSSQHRWKKVDDNSIKKNTKSSSKKRSVSKSSSKKRSVSKSSKKRSVSKSKKRSVSKSKKRSVSKSSKKRSVSKSSKPSKYNSSTFTSMLAHKYTDQNISNYLASEKLDGVRAIYYNGKFMSRTNKPFFPPKWFVEDFPKDTVIDGELFTKRNDFSKILSIVSKNNPIDSEWKQIKFMAFDLPLIHAPFSERYNELLKLKAKYLKPVKHHVIKDLVHLDKIHKELVKLGAEGTMLKNPESYYEGKRTKNLLKYKDFQDDEAVITGFEKGTGKNVEILGKLKATWLRKNTGRNTQDFSVGSGFSDLQRQNYKKLFPVGTIIKVKFFGLTSSNKPRFAIYLATLPKKMVH